MPLPKQVEEAGKKADEAAVKLEKELNGEKEATPVNAEVEPKPAAEMVEPKTIEEAKGQVASLQSAVALMEHKFSVLQGKYDSEVKPASETSQRATQLEATNSVLTDQLVEAKGKIAELSAVEQKPVKAKAPAQIDIGAYFSPEVVEKLDDEGVSKSTLEVIVNAVVGATADRNRTQTANMVAPIKKGIKEVQENQAVVAQQNYWGYIDTHVPDNESVNQDPRWLKWLGDTIIGTNFTRREALRSAEKRNDAEKIVELFNEFKKSVGLPVAQAVRRKIEDDISPINPNTPSSEGGIPTGKNYTRAQVKEFFNDRAKGRYKHLADDGQSLEDDITMAHVEGRIVN